MGLLLLLIDLIKSYLVGNGYFSVLDSVFVLID